MDITANNTNADQNFVADSGPAVSDDLSTLTWCLDEIRTALEESEAQLVRHLEQGGSDPETLESARNWLHQAGGALVILDLVGTTQLVSNAEGVLRRVADGQTDLSADVVSVIGRAYNALCEYLQELLDGIEPQPMYLYPYLKSLLKITGEERINPSDLFFPPIGNIVADLPEQAAPLNEVARKKSRTDFESGLLRVLRQPNDAEAISLMLSAVKTVSHSLEGARDANFWQVVKAWFTAISAGTHELNDEGKRLLARLNLQLRSTLDGAPPDCNPLLRHALFAIATGNPDSPELREVFVAFDLTGRVPAKYESPRYGNMDRRALTGAISSIDEMKKAWETMMQEAGGVMVHLGAFKAGLAKYQDSIADLDESGLDRITGAWVGVAKTIGLENGPVGDSLGVEVATSMLFVEQLFHGGMAEMQELDARCAEIAKRIDSTLHDVPVSDDAPQWLRDLTASVQERLTMSEFIAEIQASISEAEGSLDQWFRDKSVTEGLAGAAENFRQIGGVLKLFSHTDAAMASEHIADITESLADPEKAENADTSQLASSIGTLGFFVDALAGQKGAVDGFEFNQETGNFQYRGNPRQEVAAPVSKAQDAVQNETARSASIEPVQVPEVTADDQQEDISNSFASTAAASAAAAGGAVMFNEFASDDVVQSPAQFDSAPDSLEISNDFDFAGDSDAINTDTPEVQFIADLDTSDKSGADPSFEFAPLSEPSDDQASFDVASDQSPAADDAVKPTETTPSSLDSIADLDFDDISFGDDPATPATAAVASKPEELLEDLAASDTSDVPSEVSSIEPASVDSLADAPDLSFADNNEFADDLIIAQTDLSIPTAQTLPAIEETASFEETVSFEETPALDATPSSDFDSVVQPQEDFAVSTSDPVSFDFDESPQQPDTPTFDAEVPVFVPAEPEDAPLAQEAFAEAPVVQQPVASPSAPMTPTGDSSEAVAAVAVVAAAAAVTAPTAQSVVVDEIDEELLEIFLLEAEEVVETIAQSHQQLTAAPSDTEVQTTIRRSFHTLKGSSRMVGLNTFGEAGYAMEELMNHQLSQGGAASPDLLTLIEESNSHFGKWAQALQEDSSNTQYRGDDIVARANALRTGEPLPPEGQNDISCAPVVSAESATQEPAAQEELVQEAESIAIDSIVISEPSVNESFADLDLSDAVIPEVPITASAPEVIEPVAPEVEPAPVQSEQVAQPAQEESKQQSTGADVFTATASVAGVAGLASSFAGSDPVDQESTSTTEPVKPEAVIEEPAEEFVQIGDQQISAGLFEVFNSEIDEIKSRLLPDASDWQTNPERNASEQAIRGVHSIKGSAALVQCEPGRTLADLLEKFLLAQSSTGRVAELSDVAEYARLLQVMFASIKEFARREVPVLQDDAIAAAQALVEDWQNTQSQSSSGSSASSKSPVSSSATTSVAAPVDVTDEFDEELLPLFVAEAEELLPQIDENLRVWQESPSDTNISPLLMRQLHTVKGSARMAGAMVFGQRVHEMETRVEAAIAANTVPAGLIEELIAEQDIVSEQFEIIRDPSRQAPAQVMPAQVAASALQADGPAGIAAKTESAPDPVAANRSNTAQSLIRVRAEVVEKMVNEAGEVSIARSRLDNSLSGLRQSMAELSENVTRLRTHLREVEIQADAKIQANEGDVKPEAATDDFDPLEFDRYTRFQELTRMLAESVNDVATVQKNASRHLDDAAQDLTRQGLSMRQLQNKLMSVRMVQFASVNDRLYRVVRQVAKELEKRVSLDVTGSDSEVDRNILESMAAPLEHLLRNAVSHGIESPADRKAANKPAKGELHLDIRHDGNEIVLTLSDDGAGLNLGKIRAKGIERGLIEEGQEVTDHELGDLIFNAGFSTASQIDQISGRGVGMDVVRSEAAGLGGRVEVFSEAGKGSRFVIHLPLTMSITQVMTASAGESMFAVPAASVEKVLQVKADELSAAYAQREIDWDGEKVPLYYIASLVDMSDHKPVAQQFSPVMILRSGGKRIAVHADEVSKGQEVVVKNVGPQVSRVPGVAGATVMGNGDVVLILNLGQFVGSISETVQDAAMEAGMAARLADAPPIVMVVDDSVTVRKVTERLLTRESFEVVLAKDGVDALRQLQEITPDIMLVDIEMPRMDGFDLTRALRKDERFCKIPIVMITSRTADKHKNYAMSLGVDEFLGKPYIETELISVIRSRIGTDKSEH